MKRVLYIFFISIFLFSCDLFKRDRIHREYYYDSGNLLSETFYYANGNIGWSKQFYDNELSEESVVSPLSGISDDNKNILSKWYGDYKNEYYPNGQIKKMTTYSSDGKKRWVDSFDKYGNKKIIYWNEDAKSAGYYPCNIDKENSVHSWDQFNNGYDGLTWRCRGVDNGQYVDNCNCQDYLKIDNRWPKN